MIDRTGWQYIGIGLDSQVYRVRNQVAKLYTKWITNTRDDILEQYKRDTIKAKRIIDANDHVFKGMIKGHHSGHTINILILAQGNVIKDEDYLISLGQRYIPGKNMFDMTRDEGFFGDVYQYMEKAIFTASDMIGDKMKRDFEIVRCNVKPVHDAKNKRLDLIITDLAKCIQDTYKEMFQ